ncbi:MAG: biopolymer transporter ExbD [Treponema sp.]|jgi:biopolymer transport protein ExbD|nr:biopolymer transporter ExbD [Treponema sp.]
MKLNRRKKLGFTDSSASSDIAFLLIIYFIVIAGFNINKGFLINLPNKDSTRLILKEDLLRFEMDGEGNIIHEEQTIGIKAAEKLIASVQAGNPNVAVMLSIDPQASWQNVVTFVEIAQDLKIDSFSFSMKKDAP